MNRIIITGATNGLGLEIVKAMIDEYEIIASGRNIKFLEGMNINKYIIGDIRNPRIQNSIIDESRYCAGIILNAGETFFGYDSDIDYNRAYDILNTNVLSNIRIIKESILNKKLNDKFFIVVVSSALSNISGPFQSLYGASKAFLSNYVKNLQNEYKNSNIKLILINPGGIYTNMFTDIVANNNKTIIDRLTPNIKSPEYYAYQIKKCIKDENENCTNFIDYFLEILSNIVPSNILNNYTYTLYNDIYLETNSIKYLVLGSGNIGSLIAYHLMKEGRDVKIYSELESVKYRTIQKFFNKKESIEIPTTNNVFDIDIVIITIPSQNIEKRVEEIGLHNKLLIIPETGPEQNINLEYISLGMPIMAWTDDSNILNYYQIKNFLLNKSNNNLIQDFYYYLNKSGLSVEFVNNVSKELYPDSVLLTLITTLLEYRNWDITNISYDDWKIIMDTSYKIDGTTIPDFIMYCIVNMSPTWIIEYFRQHYKRLKNQTNLHYKNLYKKHKKDFSKFNNLLL